jgi:hypothetical protein
MEGYNLMCMTKIVISNSENYTIHPDRNNFIRIYIYIYMINEVMEKHGGHLLRLGCMPCHVAS